jgi:hypothetical protein
MRSTIRGFSTPRNAKWKTRACDALNSLSDVEVKSCTQRSFWACDVGGRFEHKLGAQPDYAYRCAIQVTHTVPRLGRRTAPVEGFFFKSGETFVFVGAPAHGFVQG